MAWIVHFRDVAFHLDAGPSPMQTQRGFTLIELMIVIAILGILLAIAIPAYSDYTVRTRISEGLNLATAGKTQVSETRLSTGLFPGNNPAAGMSNTITSTYVADLQVSGAGIITITFNTAAGAIPEVAGADTIIMTPTFATNTVQWNCTGGTVAARFRPARCRP
jgi:type IV pilus assembly protein PilA